MVVKAPYKVYSNGTNLIKRLLKEGHDVVSFDNYVCDHQVGSC